MSALAKLKAPLVRVRGQWVLLDAEEIKDAIARSSARTGGSRAVQPRCGATFSSPSAPAIQAAALGPVYNPPSAGGATGRRRSRANSAGFRIVGARPLCRRWSPSGQEDTSPNP